MKEFNFKKKFGQNFLNDNNIINKIVNSINPLENDMIIEIGPGSGALTKELKKYRANLLAFEIDTDTKKYLLPLEDEKTHIIYKDILSVDLKEEIKSYDYENLFFIGNLPYYITTPIIEKIIESKIDFTSLTVMVQKVADRFLSKPHSKEYGYITVLLNYWFDIEKVIDVNRTKFTPSPKVDSTVVKMTRKKTIPVNYDKFKKVLKESFQFKRKNIGNNLKTFDREKLEYILKNHGFNLSTRAEELDLEVFIDLANA